MINKTPEKVMPKKDVVVVGLGWTGSIMAKEFAKWLLLNMPL